MLYVQSRCTTYADNSMKQKGASKLLALQVVAGWSKSSIPCAVKSPASRSLTDRQTMAPALCASPHLLPLPSLFALFAMRRSNLRCPVTTASGRIQTHSTMHIVNSAIQHM